MAYALEVPYPQVHLPWEEYGMSPVADLHGDFCLHWSSFLLQTLKWNYEGE